MRKSRFTEERIIGVLKEHEAGARAEELCRRHGISGTTFYKWKAKFGGMDVSDARKLKGLEDENRRLKKLLAEQMLDNAVLKDLVGKNFMNCPAGLPSGRLFSAADRRRNLWPRLISVAGGLFLFSASRRGLAPSPTCHSGARWSPR